MSVNITVSGKFSKKSKFDPEGYKKQLENERRKLRLQQVREQSKEFARKIRTEVAQEKVRQLRNMETVKAQEMSLWRKSFVAKKKAEFQKALSQVGSAQLAARKETERLAQPKKPPTRTPISRRNRVGVQKECEKPKNNEPTKSKTSVTVEKNSKSKQMNVCFDENQESCMYVSSLDSFSTEELLGTCDFCTSSSLTSLDLPNQTNSKTTQTESVNGIPLKRAPTVLLDVDALQTVTEHIQIPTNICDNHVETNRQYISVVCVKPIKETVGTQTDETMAQNVESTSIPSDHTTTISTARPRYTQISDLIAKQKSAEQEKGSGDMADTIIEEVIEKLPSNLVDKPSSVPVVSATEKQNIPLRITSSVPSTKVSPKKRTRPYPINRMPSHVSRFSTTTVTTTTTTGSSKECEENAVKFYDYNNKYAKEYAQPPNVVSVIERNSDELNAMERAELESQRKIEREKELEILKKKTDERGKLALEREKVRRDCIELTAKLDALVDNGKPLLPTDANLHSKAYYTGQTARKEAKMNSAIEELLTRPTIITLPEVRNEITTITTHKERERSQKGLNSKGINVDARLSSGESDNAASKSTDTDGSGSILLGYIDDQRDQIRSQLSQCEGTEGQNLEKRNKLSQLLQRIEALRSSLLAELQKNEENEMPSKDEKQKQNIPAEKGPTQNQAMDKREQELKDREIRLQNQLAEVIQIQKRLRPEKEKPTGSNAIKISAGKEQRIQKSSSDAPLEIVIKVKGDIKRPKRKEKKRSKSVENEKEKQPAPPVIPSMNKETTNAPNLNSRCSYDSNSTHYQSIPSVLPVATEQFVERMKQSRKKNEKKQPSSCRSSVSSSSSSEASDEKCAEIQKPTRNHLNPLIAQYIQRLLGMSRQSVRALEVSSSEIETPSSSIINMTTNKPTSSGSTRQQGSFLTDDQLKRVEEFVNENRSFINELEESIRTHSNTSLESSLRRFEEIWRQKLKDERTLRDESVKPSQGSILKTNKSSNEKVKEKAKKPSRQETESQTPLPPPPTRKTEISQQKKSQQKESKKSKEKSPERHLAPDENYATQAQLNHYAELTKNCSNRIAELTALINKVREEKQRIMENTLTSVSDNGRNSTEYAELPQQQNTQELHAIEQQERIQNIPPLEKHKQTGRSRDSGISMQSRPVTALGYDTAQDPLSYASTNTQSSSTQRKQRHPPPTMQRYSPQLPDDEVVHELSTIIEVDTPVTSRINASIQATQTDTNTLQAGRKTTTSSFPTFEQYCKDHNLDVTTLDPEQSIRMEHEYNELVEAMKDGYGYKAYNYEEFPTLTTYLDNLTGSEQVCQTAETLEDLFGCLRLAPLIVKPFPSHKDYRNRLTEEKLIDSASLENLTETHSAHSEGESETLDIESELKRRNILKKSFRSTSARYDAVSSSTCEKNQKSTTSKPSSQTTTVETGIQKLTITTSSDSASEKFQRELLALGLKWHKPMRNKEKEAAALSSTSCSPPLNATNEKNLKSSKKHKSKKPESECLSDSESSDRPLNLRDFLTRQLMKHVAATASSCGSSSLSGDSSLRSQFFMAVLDSMSPSGSPRTNTGSNGVPQHNLERQKTSTPVQRSNTNIEPSKSVEASQSQLFSNESNLSMVQSSATKKSSTSPKSKPKRRHEKEGEGQ